MNSQRLRQRTRAAAARAPRAALRDGDLRRQRRPDAAAADAGALQSGARPAASRTISRLSASIAPNGRRTGSGRISPKAVRSFISDTATASASEPFDPDSWDVLASCMTRVSGDATDPELYQRLAKKLDQVEAQYGTNGNVIFYLAVAQFAVRHDHRAARRSRVDEGGQEAGAGSSSKSRSAPTLNRRGRWTGASSSVLSEIADLSDGPFSRQGNGPEHHGPALRERHLRAAVEPRSYRPCPDHGRRDGRRRAARRISTRRPGRCATWCRTMSSSCSA